MQIFQENLSSVGVPILASLGETVKQILSAKKANPDADVSALEAEIDQLVYSLYGLTREEIAIIEESLQERTAGRKVADDGALEEQT